MVFNGEGNIVSWKFTKGTGFHHVKTLLEAIHSRSQSQNQAVKVYIDNCCQWRAKVQGVVGSHVLLDVFHAVQRVSKTTKRHPFHTQCLHDLRLALRAPDFGETRTKPTPQPDEIVKKLRYVH